MPRSAKEFTKITALIKLILNGYPGNWAILREYLQNTDDSGATSQIFLLDERQYPTTSLVDAVLVGSQGPALIAINNGIITDRDWEALLKINSSSKQENQTQTGKNGLGFRASYHLTENPHILSGTTLMILDPHNEFSDHPGGVSIDLIDEGAQYTDQILPFASCIDEPLTFPYNGTAFRLPLRTAAEARKSDIKQTPTSVNDIREVLAEFSTRELEEAILFLKHVTSIEIFHIDPSGTKSCLAKVTIDPPVPSPCPPTLIRRTTTMISVNGKEHSTTSREWKLHYSSKTKAEAKHQMNQRLGYDIENRLTQDKLSPTVDIAFPLEGLPVRGRLFTLLPLPQYTEFPFHLNAVFALDPSRQNLKNIQEVGVANSRERLLVEWNKMISDTWTPGIWCDLFFGLPSNVLLSENWKLWPPEEYGENSYWTGVTRRFTSMVVSRRLPVFPTFPGDTATSRLVRITDPDVLLAPSNTQISLTLLSNLGISIVQPPRHIYAALVSGKHAVFLSPETLHSVLLRKAPSEYDGQDDSDLKIVMDYLVFDSGSADLTNLAGLPWFRRAKDNNRVSLELSGHGGNARYFIPQTSVEAMIFVNSPAMLEWNTFSERLRKQLSQRSASRILNVSVLGTEDVVSFLKYRFAHLQSSSQEILNAKSDCDYVTDFWTWVVQWSKGEEFFQSYMGKLSELFLLPTSRESLRKLSSGIIHFDANDTPFVGAWNALEIYSISQKIPYPAILKLRSAGVIPHPKSWSQTLFLINNANLSSTVPETVFADIRAHLSENLPRATGNITAQQRAKFRQFPIFMVRDIQTGKTSMNKSDGHCVYIRVGETLPLPLLRGYPNVIYVDVNDSTTLSFARLLDNMVKVENEISVLQMAIENWDIQPNDTKDKFIDQIFLYRPHQLPPTLCKALKDLPFVIVNDTFERKRPTKLIHPNSTIANLYLGEPGRMPAGHFGVDRALAAMSEFGFLRSSLDSNVVRDRIVYLTDPANAADRHLINKAHNFITLLNHEWKLEYAPIVEEYRSRRWIPCDRPTASLVSPAQSRDNHRDDHTHPYYFDRVLTCLQTKTFKPEFRTALGWSTTIPSEILVEQLRETLNSPSNRANRLIKFLEYLNRIFLSDSVTGSALQNFRSAVAGRAWVPSNSRVDDVIHSHHALLLDPSDSRLKSPFRFVPPELLDCLPILRALGCNDRPPLDVLIIELDGIYETSPIDMEAWQAILQEIADRHRDKLSDRINILGDDGRSHPLPSIYFRDSSLHPLDMPASLQERFAAHTNISPLLAQSLGIPLLSSLLIGDDDDDEEEEEEQMGVDFVTTVKRFLSDYDPQYALNEVLANADDAHASSFSILLDQRRLSPSGNVIHPTFKVAIARETLFFYNDSQLTQNDLIGIRRVGRGGKQGDVSTHGRHGLGALSLYYFTDVATIISGETVLFLDPSSRYLPLTIKGNRRTLLQRKVSRLMSVFPGQLERYEGIFGFSSQDSKYNGTLFCLPLNASITEKACDIVKITGYLEKSYRHLASLALLFTNLRSITAETLGTGQRSTIWSLSGSRTNDQRLGHCYECHSLTIREHNQNQTDTETKWIIATSEMGMVPQGFYQIAQRLKLTPGTKVQLAIDARAVPNRTFPFQGYTFSTVPLPRPTSLPFHLNARFAISSNRQDLVLNPSDSAGERDIDTLFNRWILESLVPPLYLEALSLLISRMHKGNAEHEPQGWSKRWFLSHCNEGASKIIQDAFLKALPDSNHLIFTDATGSLVSFSEAVFSRGQPEAITKCLKKLETPTFVSHSQYKDIAKLDCSTVISPGFVRNALLRNAESTLSFLSDEPAMCCSLFNYLTQELDESVPLIGLPLLVLQSGAVIPIPGVSDSPVYHCESSSHAALFSSSQFMVNMLYDKDAVTKPLLYDKDAVTKRLLNDSSINVASLTKDNAIDLIRAQLQHGSSQRLTVWLNNFWALHHMTLPGPPTIESLESARPVLPMIEATKGSSSSLLSLHECQPDTVIYDTGLEQQLVDILHTLEFPVITHKHNKYLKTFLKNRFKNNNLSNVLRCLVAKGIGSLDSLNPPSSNCLSMWIQQRLAGVLDLWTRDPSLIPVGKSNLMMLKIWNIYSNGAVRRDHALDIKVLPTHMNFEAVAPYLPRRTRVALGSLLLFQFLELCSSRPRNLIICPPSDLLSVLSLPATVTSPKEIEDLKNFLESMLRCYSKDSLESCQWLVPDIDGTLRPFQELYDDSIALFRSTLRFTQPPSFLHDEFKSFGYSLRRLNQGVIHEITIETFIHCANAVSEAHRYYLTNPERPGMLVAVREMSNDAFHIYQTRIPALMLLRFYFNWSSTDRISFVLRKAVRRQGATYDIRDNYVAGPLPLILPPSSFVLPAYEPIAWTQRALFLTEPIEGLVTVNKTLGIPAVEEVVAHLVLLTTVIALDHSGDRTLLSDIKATYTWLNENAGSATIYLRQSGSKKLFLNIEDPSTDSWDENWVSSEELILNMEFDQGPIKVVLGFLRPYEALLRAAGCEEISTSHGTAPTSISASNTPTVQAWKIELDKMRKANLLNDMELLPTTESIPIEPERNTELGDDDVAFTPITPTVGSEINGTIDNYEYAGGTKTFDRKHLRAHRVIMAAAVPFLRDLQLWRQSTQPSGGDEMKLYGSPFAAKAVIDFVYTGELELSMTTTDQTELTHLMHDLLDVLPVVDEWGMTDLKEKIQWEIVSKHEIVRRLPQEYDTLLSYATKYSADQILNALKELEHFRAKIQKLRRRNIES